MAATEGEMKGPTKTKKEALGEVDEFIRRCERDATVYEEHVDLMLNPDDDLGVSDDVAPDGWRKSDLGNAERLVARHGHDLKYCRENRTWYAWDNKRWAPDVTGELERRAQNTIRNLCRGADSLEKSKDRVELIRWSLQSENARRLADMVKIAESAAGVAITRGELDADSCYLGCLNGVLDTRNGKLLPHDRKYLITKLAPVEYDPDATFPLWDKFLDDTTGGNVELKAFLQRAVGCSLTAEPADDDRFFFVHGPPAGGKSTFIEAIRAVFGDYAKAANFDTITTHYNAGSARQDLAELNGARLVTMVEIPEENRLDEPVLASLTGGDTITARFLYKGEFEFIPRFKLWIAGNNEPVIKNINSPIWRRLLKIPFTRIIPEAKRDPKVKKTLRKDPRARAAVLAWAVKGCIEWRKHGLNPPDSVKTATATYRAEQDTLAEFIESRCVIGAECKANKENLCREYQDWAESTRLRPAERLSARAFARRINADPRFDIVGRKTVYGIGLQADSEY